MRIDEILDLSDEDSQEDIERKLGYGENEYIIRPSPIKWLREKRWYNFNDNWDSIVYVYEINNRDERVETVVFFEDIQTKQMQVITRTWAYDERGELYDPNDVDDFHKDNVEPADDESFRDIIMGVFGNFQVIDKEALNHIR